MAKSQRRKPPFGTEQATNFLASLLHHSPRKAILANIAMLTAIGLFVGVVVGTTISLGTAHIPNKALLYSVNVVIALLARLMSQWVLVLVGRPIATGIVNAMLQKASGRREEATVRIPLAEFDRGLRIEIIAGLTVTLATILSTEAIHPDWLTDPLNVIWLTGCLGLAVGLIEGLSLPTNIHVLAHGRLD